MKTDVAPFVMVWWVPEGDTPRWILAQRDNRDPEDLIEDCMERRYLASDMVVFRFPEGLDAKSTEAKIRLYEVLWFAIGDGRDEDQEPELKAVYRTAERDPQCEMWTGVRTVRAECERLAQ